MLSAIKSLSAKVQWFLAILFVAGGIAALAGSPPLFETRAYAQSSGGCPGPEDDPCPSDFPYCCSDGACHDCPCE